MVSLYNLEVLSFDTRVAFLTLILAILVSIAVKFRFSTISGKKLPPGSLGFPLVGETLSFLKSAKLAKTDEWFSVRIKKHGPVFKSSVLGTKTVILTGQAGNRFVFTGGDNGIASNFVERAARVIGRKGIFELSGSRHKLVRGSLMSFLRPENIQRYVGEMDCLVQKQISQELDGKDSVQIVPFMKRIAFKITCSLLFGLQEGKVKDQLFEDFPILVRGTGCIPWDLPGTKYRKALQARGRVCKLLSDLIRSKRQMEDQKLRCNADIISSLLSARDDDNEPLSEEEIIDNLITLIIASHDTTAVLLYIFIRQLARDSEVFNKVLEEQTEVVQAREKNDGKISWNEVQMMKYTWRVAQELMRLTPPIVGNMKSASRDINFGGFDIPKGWKVCWAAVGTHMDNDIFEDPEKFDPSRFERASKSFPPYTYIPFGAGPRICPGSEFARIEVLLIVHHMISRYEWKELIPNEPLTCDPLPVPAKGLPVKLQPRKIV